MNFVCTGDTVAVHSIDRLARNLDDLRNIVPTLTEREVRIEFSKEHLVFTGDDCPMANLMLSVMGAFAEFERALVRERQREGIVLLDPLLRQRVTAGLNKGEAKNTLARAVCFNRLGEIRDRTCELQRHRASGLNLVIAAIIL